MARVETNSSITTRRDFLLRTAATGDFAELCAALLPCKTGSVGRLRKSSALILELIAPVAFGCWLRPATI